jgi:hypothetical protein
VESRTPVNSHIYTYLFFLPLLSTIPSATTIILAIYLFNFVFLVSIRYFEGWGVFVAKEVIFIA